MNRLFLLIALIIFSLTVSGQTIDELKKKKEKTNEKIKYTSKLLEEAKKNEKTSLNKLKVLDQQIQLRKELIDDYNREIGALEGQIDQNSATVQSLNRDLQKLKDEYAETVRFAQKNRNSYDKIMFLLSADNFNQAYKRLMYLQQYTDFRKRQAEVIDSLKRFTNSKISELEKQKSQKKSVSYSKQREADRLGKEMKQQGQQVASLQKKQKELQRVLREQQKVEAQLNREIDRIIEEETRKSKAQGSTGFTMTPEQKLIAGKLEQNKGRLPWPVERGIITERFGVHAHAVLKTVQVKNNGVDITTEAGSKARAVFDGEVSRVFGISGGNIAIIIRHGNYLTVYSNLKDVSVKQGDKIKAKQSLGTVFSDPEDANKTVLKFQIRKESQTLDPESWLSK